MGRRTLPVALVLAAALAEIFAAHGAAFYLIVAAVPATALCALSAFGRLVELPARAAGTNAARLEVLLAAVGLALVVAAAAVRANPVVGEGVPPLGVSALAASIAVLAFQRVLTLSATDAAPSLPAERSAAG